MHLNSHMRTHTQSLQERLVLWIGLSGDSVSSLPNISQHQEAFICRTPFLTDFHLLLEAYMPSVHRGTQLQDQISAPALLIHAEHMVTLKNVVTT